jgi:hypothetical protein
MLTIAQLENNKKKFLETNVKYNIFTKELLDFLGEDLYTSPSSSSSNMIGCYPGGLLHHIIKACRYAIKLNEILPDDMKEPVASIIKVVFLCQIGKVFMFKLNDRPNLNNKIYDFNDDIVRLHVGERSAYYALKYGVTLTETEFQCLVNIDKESDDKMAKYFSSVLTQVVKNGFELAVMEEKNGKKQSTVIP